MFWTSRLNKRNGLSAWCSKSFEGGHRPDILVEISDQSRPVNKYPRDNSSVDMSIYSSVELIKKQPNQDLSKYRAELQIRERPGVMSHWFAAIGKRTRSNFILYSGLNYEDGLSLSQVESDFMLYENLSGKIFHPLFRCLMAKADPTANIEYTVTSAIQSICEHGWQRQFDLNLRQILMTWAYHKLQDCLQRRGLSFFSFYAEILIKLTWTLTIKAADFHPISFATGNSISSQNHYFTMFRQCTRLLFCDTLIARVEEVYTELPKTEQLAGSTYLRIFGALFHVLIPAYKPPTNSLRELCGKAVIQNLNYPAATRGLKVVDGPTTSRKYLVFPPPVFTFTTPDIIKSLPVPCKRFIQFRQHYLTTGKLNCYFCTNYRHDFSFHKQIDGKREQDIQISESLQKIFLTNGYPVKGQCKYIHDPSNPSLPLYHFT